MSRAVGLVGVAALALAAAWALRGPPPAEPAPAVEATPPARAGAPAGMAEAPDAAAPSPPAMAPDAIPEPRALRGTRPSGDLRVDADGHFVPGPESLLFFEYFLSASNELPIEALVARMVGAIRARLDPPADAEAEVFLADYLDYLAAGDRELATPGLAGSADLERRFQWVRELRREHFGAELAERLFADEETAARIHLERRRIRSDPDLSPEARRARLAELEAGYPESVRAARARATEPLRHAREESMLRAAGATPGEIHELRVERFGPEAAERMAALDARRARWNERLAAWRAERDALAAATPDPAERAAALEALRAEHFTPEEARRVRALDAIDPEAPGALGPEVPDAIESGEAAPAAAP
jgi:lipase chaperone LimK